MEWICQQAPPFLLPRWYNVLAWVAACAIITGTLATKVCVYVCVRACVRACVLACATHSLTACAQSFVLFSAHPVFMSLACVGFMTEVRAHSHPGMAAQPPLRAPGSFDAGGPCSACVQAIASYRQVNEKTTQRRRHRILNLGAARAFLASAMPSTLAQTLA